jgi:hypothetical protein
MSPIKIIGYIAAAVLIFFGILFIWGAFSPTSPNPFGWIIIGLISIIIGFGLIWLASRQKPSVQQGSENITLKIDLPGDVKMDTLKCQSCGGVLSPKDISMVAGAPVVTCPYCHTTYQLSEEPKW